MEANMTRKKYGEETRCLSNKLSKPVTGWISDHHFNYSRLLQNKRSGNPDKFPYWFILKMVHCAWGKALSFSCKCLPGSGRSNPPSISLGVRRTRNSSCSSAEEENLNYEVSKPHLNMGLKLTQKKALW